jgi:hypothetical protein
MTDNQPMKRWTLRKTSIISALFAGSAFFLSTWGATAQADPGGGGAMKIVGASYTQELRYANCMREHGEPEFPDPSSNGVFTLNNIDPNTPQYSEAQKACQKLLPRVKPPTPAEQARTVAKAVAYAHCMRAHGEPGFSDPSTAGGGISFSLRNTDPNSPQFQRAQDECRSLSPFPGGTGMP